MSKSIGNVVAPQKICNSLGADVLRLWVAATDYSGELTVSDEILNRTSDAYRRIRNTLRYLLSNLDGFNPSTDIVPSKNMVLLDNWIVRETISTENIIKQHYANDYQFHNIYHLIHNFCILQLGSDYLDIIKDRQYTCQEKSHARRSSQTAQYYIAEMLVRWIAPILSFTAEEAWQHLPGNRDNTIFIQKWYAGELEEFTASKEISDADWDEISEIKDKVSKLLEEERSAKIIGSSLEAEIKIWHSPECVRKIKNDELRFIFITSYADIVDDEEPHKDAIKLHNSSADSADYFVLVKKSEHQKCVRCWHHREDVGADSQHPELCFRCISNLPDAQGEVRKYA
jgi:isoleucyl-tRNA synthetase